MAHTQSEIDSLKRQWSADPSWDIEDTQGFEEHRQELYIYRLEVENKQMRRTIEKFHEWRRQMRSFLSID